MAENSKIEWTHHTFNPWRGCTKVSSGCDHCYAETMSGRNPSVLGVWGKHGTRVVASEAMWREPVKWDRFARDGVCPECHGKGWFGRVVPRIVTGPDLIDTVEQEAFRDPCENCDSTGKVEPYRSRVFCASLADVFEGNNTIPAGDAMASVAEARYRLFCLIEQTPNLDWLLLTKRPENVMRLAPIRWTEAGGKFPDNVWLGVSVEDQKTAKERIPHLLKTPAAVRFLSIEPLLGPIDLDFGDDLGPDEDSDVGCAPCDVGGMRHQHWLFEDCLREIHWVIVGGESGPDARPMHPGWGRSIRDQCVAAGVPFFFKQWGEYWPYDSFYLSSINHPFGPIPADVNSYKVLDFPENHDPMQTVGRYFVKLGKAKAGRILDGRTWDEFPEVKK